jgi:hypothetical protein
VLDISLTVTGEENKVHNGTRLNYGCKMNTRIDDADQSNPLTYSIPAAGRMAGLAKNASYAAARRGEIPVIKFGGKRRVPASKWMRILAEGRDPVDAE